MCTCDYEGQTTCTAGPPRICTKGQHGLYNLKDTDNDGINDHDETVGIMGSSSYPYPEHR